MDRSTTHAGKPALCNFVYPSTHFEFWLAAILLLNLKTFFFLEKILENSNLSSPFPIELFHLILCSRALLYKKFGWKFF